MIRKADVDEVFLNKKTLNQIRRGLDKYHWLQATFAEKGCGGLDFQRKYKGFYRVRRGPDWCGPYFALMESARRDKLDFEAVLLRMAKQLGRIEASFASKLVATIDPRKPVIDRYVLKSFGLQLPRYSSELRKEEIVSLYKQLGNEYKRLKLGAYIQKRFDEAFPMSGITALKKIDLVLWQIRPKNTPST